MKKPKKKDYENRMDVQMYVVTHKQVDIPRCEGYIPMVVGNHSVTYDNAVHDNTGENIADKNSNYCELTALYWMWKNLDVRGGYGLCHYRRFFIYKSDKEPHTLDIRKVPRFFKGYDIILPTPTHWENITVERQLLDTSISEYNFGLIKEAISTLYPEYLSAYDEVFSGHYASYCNMFVMPSKEMLDSYCKWLFDILFFIEKYADLENASNYEKRIYGFISERLLNVWVKKNGLRVKYLQIGDQNSQYRLSTTMMDKLRASSYGVYGNGRISRFAAQKTYSAIRKILDTVRKTKA